MKNLAKSLLAVAGLGLSAWLAPAQAQTYTFTAAPDTIVTYGDTLRYWIPTTTGNAITNATIRVYSEIDNGDVGEYLDWYGETWSAITATQQAPGGDCSYDTTKTFSIPQSDINAWAAGGIWIYALPSGNVDQFCNDWVSISISFDTCSAGTPVQYAQASAADSSVCPTNAPVALTGLPIGGTFSGVGVSGISSTFNPAGLAPGNYVITYRGTDAIGCTTEDQVVITIERAPVAMPMLVCPGSPATLTARGGGNFVWYGNAGLTQVLDTIPTFVTQNLNQTTVYYVRRFAEDAEFSVDSLGASAITTIDHDAATGDDRAGLVLSDSFVFVIGDNNIARYDLNFGGTAVTFPVNDGIFTNLSDRSVWMLYNGTAAPTGTLVSTYTVTELREMNNSLGQTGNILTLSRPITLNCSNGDCGVMSGAGLLGLYSYNDSTWYTIDLSSGTVDSIGKGFSPLYNTENWAFWGTLEYDGANYSAIYHNGNNGNEIVRQQLPNGTPAAVLTSGGFGDLSSVIVDPTQNRWYGHCEGCAFFGGGSENAGYAYAGTFLNTNPQGVVGCANSVTVTVPTVNIGPDTTVCQGTLYPIFAGLGYSSYTWNGVNNNFNAYTVNATGSYNVAVVDQNGCTLRDTVVVTFDAAACTGVEETANASFSVFPNPTSGEFTIVTNDFVSEGDFNVQAFDMMGRVVLSQTFGSVQGSFSQQFSLRNLPAGVYNLRLSDARRSQTIKLILE